MFLNAFPARSRAGQPCPPDDVTYFDFAVFERPVYVPRSNPLAVPTPIPVNDKDGNILDFIEMGLGVHRYLVGYENEPNLTVSVKMMDILDWVSERNFEEWHWQRTKEEESRLLTTKMHWKRRMATEKGGDSRANSARDLEQAGGKQPSLSYAQLRGDLDDVKIVPGMRVVSKSPPQGPGRRRRIPAIGGHSSLSQPSILSPPNKRQRGLAEASKSESEEIDEDYALAIQLNMEFGGIASVSQSRSTTEPRELSNNPHYLTLKPPHRQSRLAESSRSISTSSSGAKCESKAIPPTNPLTTKRRTPTKSFFVAGQLLPGKANVSRKPTPKTDDSEVYEVECILDDKVVTDKYGAKTTFYLIRWQGDWDDTWEPSENVGRGARNEYRKTRKAMKHAQQMGAKLTKRKRETENEEERDVLGLESDVLGKNTREDAHRRRKRISKSRLNSKSPASMGDVGDWYEKAESANSRTPSGDGLFISRSQSPASVSKNQPRVELTTPHSNSTSLTHIPAARDRRVVVIDSDDDDVEVDELA